MDWRKPVKNALLCITLVSAFGCATQRLDLGKLQTVCEAETKSFLQAVDCIEGVFKAPEAATMVQGDQRLSLFVSYAGALADRVRRNQMSEPEAKYRLAAMRAEFAAQDRRASDASDQALMNYAVGLERSRAAASRQPINCVTGPNIIHCY